MKDWDHVLDDNSTDFAEALNKFVCNSDAVGMGVVYSVYLDALENICGLYKAGSPYEEGVTDEIIESILQKVHAELPEKYHNLLPVPIIYQKNTEQSFQNLSHICKYYAMGILVKKCLRF